jgi:hypothetical protein
MSRHRLHVTKLEEFAAFCEAHGWTRQPLKGAYEVLRMTHSTKHPLIVHTKLENRSGGLPEHLTLHGTAESMFSQWMRERK